MAVLTPTLERGPMEQEIPRPESGYISCDRRVVIGLTWPTEALQLHADLFLRAYVHELLGDHGSVGQMLIHVGR